ncbi:acyl-CoA synthetase FdrA [Fodinibacter luteus]|uniref:Acyl-CoA synthetase FdrA n=1 Tax=Fodinibacter luteus TaxID=552064 RepID=A0ABP8JZW1_9MICO
MSPSDGFTHVELRSAYADSVTLLQVSRDVATAPGVIAAQVAMGTPLNVDVLSGMGFDVPACTPNDLVVALRLASEEALAGALAAVADALVVTARRDDGAARTVQPRTTASAVRRSGAALALVSVPGEHAAVEAVDALDAGADVMIFSDNVPLDQEIGLKRLAAERGLLVMGPDCGTAVVGGVGLGFANVAPAGEVGIVAASGTGCQQLICLLAAAGVGVGAALGVGGRDLSPGVGGLSTMEALRRLDADPSVRRIVLVSKPPAPEVAEAVRTYADTLSTPVDLALLGPGRPDLTTATEALLRSLGRPVPEWPVWGARQWHPGPGHLRGLFVGGTLCDEAMLVAGERLGPIRSNIPLAPELALDESLTADAHLMVDFGDDALTRGRAHPMIDPGLRLEHLARAAADPATAVLLLDVVLGHGAEADPAALLAPAVAAAIATARDAGRELPVVVACVGTEDDPQGLTRQALALADAGAEVHLSNAHAATRAASLTTGASS